MGAKRDTRDSRQQLLDATGPGLRDRTILLLSWTSGDRRRSEIVSIDVEDVYLTEFDARGIGWLRLMATKTTASGKRPEGCRGLCRGRLADALDLNSGALFCKITAQETLSRRRQTPDSVAQILRRFIEEAGLSDGLASPHGPRSGFPTQAALDGAPLRTALRLSLRRSAAQALAQALALAQKFYVDVDIADNPAADPFDP